METKFTHDPVYHLKILKQVLSIEKKPIGFLLAAGCPLGVDMPTGSWPLIPAIKELTIAINEELLKDVDVKDKYTLLLDEIVKAKKSKENIEDILSFARSLKEVAIGGDVRGFSHKNLEDIDLKICTAIAKKLTVALPNNQTPYHNLSNWISAIDRNLAIEVFTLNYDLLLEEALEGFQIPYFDGFVGSREPFFDLKAVEESKIPSHWTRVWKIHGSINWFKKDEEVHRYSGNNHSNSYLIYPSHLKYDQSRKMPYLALIDRLSTFIKEQPSILVICGYSFSDDHINNSIINALKSNPSALVIGLQFGELFGYPKAIKLAEGRPNLSLWAKDEAIIGTRRGPWYPQSNANDNEALSRWVESKVEKGTGGKKDETKYFLDLGNFAKFGLFLKSLIGEIDHEE